jgi:NADH dehydrogenase
MSYSRVTVFGGSGFLGRQIVKRLAADGAAVRVAVRHPERASFLTEVSTPGWITTVHADVWDEATVGPAVDGSDAVVNTVGHYVERGGATFEAIHGQGAMHVAQASAMAGVRRLVHISGIGADPGSPSSYVRARAVGERLVKEAFPGATILRPSVMFGPEDAFFNQLAALARVMPILPLFGTGAVKLQPCTWAMSQKRLRERWRRRLRQAKSTSWADPEPTRTGRSCNCFSSSLVADGCSCRFRTSPGNFWLP